MFVVLITDKSTINSFELCTFESTKTEKNTKCLQLLSVNC